MAAGKAPHASLPVKKRPLASSSDPSFGKAASFNPLLSRLVGNLSGNRSAGVPLHEVGHFEALSRQLLEAQSVSFWIFNAILNWLKQEGFQPLEASLFEELVQAFSTCMVGSTASLAFMATFCQARRREAVLSHFPTHVGSHFRALLSASSFAGPNLFEDSVLDKVLAESREDSAVSVNLALVKAVSFPVFGAAKSGQKASSDQSSAAAASSSASRGHGRGSSRDQNRKDSSSPGSSTFQDCKRKASSTSLHKSPRRSYAKHSRGKGFRK